MVKIKVLLPAMIHCS